MGRRARDRAAYHAGLSRGQAKSRTWRARNAERRRQTDREYYQRNKDRITAQRRMRKQQAAAAGMAAGDRGA